MTRPLPLSLLSLPLPLQLPYCKRHCHHQFSSLKPAFTPRSSKLVLFFQTLRVSPLGIRPRYKELLHLDNDNYHHHHNGIILVIIIIIWKVGEAGNTLSGGQKARVALARAVYQVMIPMLLGIQALSHTRSSSSILFATIRRKVLIFFRKFHHTPLSRALS